MTDKPITKYREKGIKLTPQRLAILEFLDGNKSHPTAEGIFRAIKKNCPTVSFATVYNTLELLKKRGEISEITINPKRKHYDPDTTLHHHVVCEVCGRIEDVVLVDSKIPPLPGHLSKEFEVRRVHVDFHGVCKICQK